MYIKYREAILINHRRQGLYFAVTGVAKNNQIQNMSPVVIPLKIKQQGQPNRKVIRSLIQELTDQRSAGIRESILESALSRQDIGLPERLRLCEVLANRKFLSEAKTVLATCNSESGRFHVLRARVAYFEKEFQPAVAHWEIAKDLDTELSVPDLLKFLGACEKTENKTLLIKIAEELSSSSDLTENQIRQLAKILYRCNENTIAQKALENLDVIEDPGTLLVVARVNSSLGRTNFALQTLHDARKRFFGSSQIASDNRIYLDILLCELQVLIEQKNWPKVISQSQSLISRLPDCFPAYKYCLRAMRLSKIREDYLSVLRAAYNNFYLQYPQLVVEYCRELELHGQAEYSLTILEEANRNHSYFLSSLLERYLRDGKLEKFNQYINSAEIPNGKKLSILSDYCLVLIRKGLYAKIPGLLLRITEIEPNNILDHRQYIEFQNQLLQLHGILTSSVTDTSLIVDSYQSNQLTRLVRQLLPSNVTSTSSRLPNKALWNSLVDSKYASTTCFFENVKQSIDVYVDKIEQQSCVYLQTYENPEQARELAFLLQKRIENQIPTSVVRLGDGEGCYLDYPEVVKSTQVEDQLSVQRVWWGSSDLCNASESSRTDTLNAFRKSIANSDFLGVPPVRRLLCSFDAPMRGHDEIKSSRGLLAITDALPNIVCEDKILVSCHMHTDFQLWNCYEEILKDLDEISIISCHEGLDIYLRQRFGINAVATYPIPGESRYTILFDQNPAENHYPEVFNSIIKILPSVSRGRVFLVGAGFLGKIYCDVVKQNGGIALDVGSLLDYWAGYQTRPENEMEMTCRGLQYLEKHELMIELP